MGFIYTPVERIVTVYLAPKRKGWKKTVVPARIEALWGDTIVWEVWGDCEGHEVTIGGFKKGSKSKSPVSRDEVHTTPHRRNPRAKVPEGMAKGIYGYTIYVDGDPVKDPDIEIKGKP